jgi:sialidase-1
MLETNSSGEYRQVELPFRRVMDRGIGSQWSFIKFPSDCPRGVVLRSSRSRLLAIVVTFFSISGSIADQPYIAIVDEIRTISQQPYYHGWPTLIRRSNGQLVAVWSGHRKSHVCPFGTVDMMRSDDGGHSWTYPRTLLDSPLDDRDAGVMETQQGTLVATTFTSMAFYEQYRSKRRALGNPDWEAAIRRMPEAASRRKELGQWSIRSEDGGVTWSARIPTVVNSPHGPNQLQDGRLLYAGKRLYDDGQIGVAESKDDGVSWQWLAAIPTRTGDRFQDYHELHVAECKSGKLVAHIRNHNQNNHREILQTESFDGGHSWSTPQRIGVWGLPSHLLRMSDGRLVMTYGHRRAPFGNQARVSLDEGETWSRPMTISRDGSNHDLGYPTTAELADGTLVTLWYEQTAKDPKAVLRLARWRMVEFSPRLFFHPGFFLLN